MTLFLSSSGNRIARRTTISLAVHDPVSVVTLRLFATGQGLQCRGRHLREIKVTVDPGSKSTFNMVRDRTADMVSQTIILSGVSLFFAQHFGRGPFWLFVGFRVGFRVVIQHGKGVLDDGLASRYYIYIFINGLR